MAFKIVSLLLVVAVVTCINGQRNIALTGAQIRDLELGQNPALLEFAARTGESVLIIIDSAETLAVTQENVNANFWCLPWLERFPGGFIRWLFQLYRSDFDQPVGSEIEIISSPRRTIGGEFNEWLNITGTIIAASAETADTGRYACEVCFDLGGGLLDCHRANITLQVIGAPPNISAVPDDTGPDMGNFSTGAVEFTIGADFCIPRDFVGTIEIQCDLTDSPQAFPEPSRGHFFNDELLYLIETGTDMIVIDMDFFTRVPERSILMPGMVSPVPFSIIGSRLSFSTLVTNTTAPLDVLGFGSFLEVRQAIIELILGDWTCFANNTFGQDRATTTIRACLPAPSIQTCDASAVLFSNTGGVVPVGCTVCIPEGDVITLNCTGANDGVGEIDYVWTDSGGRVVSNSALLLVSRPGQYNCTADNMDNMAEFAASVVAFSDAVNFAGTLTEVGSSRPRADNGCSRIRNQDLTGVDVCAFIGETLELSCVTDDRAMELLEITSSENIVANGSLSMIVTMATEGTQVCRLSNTAGPCSVAQQTLTVRVFDPATIDRTSNLPPDCLGAGRFPDTVAPRLGPVRLCCPAAGIEDPTVEWFQVVLDNTGCASEQNVEDTDGVIVGSVGNFTDFTVNIQANDAFTFVCRARNSAGSDAAIVSIRAQDEDGKWITGEQSECSMMCRDGVRTRSVTCVSIIDGRPLPSTSCPASMRPPSTEPCAEYADVNCTTDPVWYPFPWGPCNRDCGGYRFRRVICVVPLDSRVLPSNYCNLQRMPLFYDVVGCNTKCCSRDNFPRKCRREGTGRCGELGFRRDCCWTCGAKFEG